MPPYSGAGPDPLWAIFGTTEQLAEKWQELGTEGTQGLKPD
jgi:hypothetical protein